jgi:hypothetical protein
MYGMIYADSYILTVKENPVYHCARWSGVLHQHRLLIDQNKGIVKNILAVTKEQGFIETR